MSTFDTTKTYRVLNSARVPFMKGELVQYIEEATDSIFEHRFFLFRNKEGISGYLEADEVKEATEVGEFSGHTALTMLGRNTTPPNWCDMLPQDRHRLLGELIDAMIYSGDATNQVVQLVEKFRADGKIRSVIMPEPSNEQP